ncbi:hypothetical protein CGLO_18172 [Colletotrichum gloeosporioides Cg-14]|uniref:Uncharacterized protein n=1 Tax=Colletotrichum gloeosporioides (strain Cg-14) TaxID=1237896 RepID=T0JV06_COLGC|nr:hypothetical protein CGLO_18172 [Colletotrichum gloeosporioides Cg-14]
MFVMNMEQH